MNNIKDRNSKEVIIQLKRAEIQKKILVKNIYKEYETYFQIVRNSIINSAEKGIFAIYSDLSLSDKELSLRELNIFLEKNISSLIYSKLPLITIEQLKLGDISNYQKQLSNVNATKELVEFNEYETVGFDYENELIDQETIEFNCNNKSNTYQYYESLEEEELASVNLDENSYLKSFSKETIIKKFEDEKNIVNAVLELIDQTNSYKLNDNEQGSDVFISNDNLNIFEFLDKSFSDFLLNLSYKINSELFKIRLINKILSEEAFKFLSNNNYIIRHPHPFAIRYDIKPNQLSAKNIKSSDIYLFNITNVELEFYNLDLSICRNNINELKSRFRILNKKQKYWKDKELTSNHLM